MMKQINVDGYRYANQFTLSNYRMYSENLVNSILEYIEIPVMEIIDIPIGLPLDYHWMKLFV